MCFKFSTDISKLHVCTIGDKSVETFYFFRVPFSCFYYLTMLYDGTISIVNFCCRIVGTMYIDMYTCFVCLIFDTM